MPLITKLFPAMERVREESDSTALNTSTEEHYGEAYGNFEEREDAEMSDGSIIHRSRPKKTTKTPAIPPRSELRASRIFENLTIELKSLEKATLNEANEQPTESDPYASYVSSEEEASESADDDDESIVELDCNRPSSSRASSRLSQEDTARVVSFMFVGKPQLVDVVSHDRLSLKRRSFDHSKAARRRPSPLRLTPDTSRPPARTSSLANSTTSLPLRQYKSSTATNSNLSMSAKHTFLQSDPFPIGEAQEVQLPSSPTDTIPKTPISIANAAWKSGIRGVTRTLSIASRKRPSMPKMSLEYTPGVVPKQPSAVPSPANPPPATPVSTAPRPSQDREPVTYQDIMRNVIRGPPPMSPKSPKLKTRTSSHLLGLGRRKSIKG